MSISWLYLLLASIFEIGWPLGFKLSHGSPHKILWIALAVVSMALSGYFLYLAQKTIPVGTAYVVWTGIGAVGTVLLGIVYFRERVSFARIFFIATLIASIIGLKMV